MKDERKDWHNSHFAVTRLSRNFGDQSQAGLISTFGNALYDTSNFVLGFDLRLGTSKFRGNKNLALNLYGLRSITKTNHYESGLPKRDLAYGVEFVYPNDLLHFRVGHMQIQEHFTAGLGFVPRPGVRQTYGEFKIGPRPEKWGILQVLAGTGLDYITDFGNGLLTREFYVLPLNIRFNSGEEIMYRVNSSFEKLDNDFNIYGQYLIPAENYSFVWHSLSIQSAQRRNLWGGLEYRFGDFYNGSRNEIKFDGGYKIAVPLFTGFELIRNDIRLLSGDFIAYIYRLNFNLLFNPDITLYSFIQYDSESNRMGWQSRFQWILEPGREIYFVWNSISQDPYERFQIEQANVRLKIKYAIRF